MCAIRVTPWYFLGSYKSNKLFNLFLGEHFEHFMGVYEAHFGCLLACLELLGANVFHRISFG